MSTPPSRQGADFQTDDAVAWAARLLHDEPGLRLAILFGSAARGALRHDSDVDLALLFDEPLNAQRRWEVASRLQSKFNRPVDIVDLFVADGTILRQILCQGRVVCRTDAKAFEGLVRRMIYNQADMMPHVRRTLLERQRRFIHGL